MGKTTEKKKKLSSINFFQLKIKLVQLGLILALFCKGINPAPVPFQEFGNKPAGFFNQNPYQFFTSTIFNQVYVMGDGVQGDITYFNPDIKILERLDIDGLSFVKSWEYSESVSDGFGFLVYHLVGSRDAVILKKTSKFSSYVPYCTYQVPAGKAIESFSINRNINKIAIVTTGGTGSNLYHYDFDVNAASGIISASTADIELTGANGGPVRIVFGADTIYATRTIQNRLFAYEYNTGTLPQVAVSQTKNSMVELAINLQETYAMGWEVAGTEMFAFQINRPTMFFTFSYFVNIFTIIKVQFGEDPREIYIFYQERIEYTPNFLGPAPKLIIKNSHVGGDTIYNGHYIINKKVLIAITDVLASYYYKLCDPLIALDCEHSIANTFFGCNDVTKYSDNLGTCQPCHANCDGCYGATDFDCYACKPPSTDTAGQCTSGPPPPVCDATCATCSGTADYQCLTCTLPRVISGDFYCCDVSGNFELEAVTNNCVATIPPVIPEACGEDCTLCEATISNGECLDTILPKIEEHVQLKRDCFKLEDYFSNQDFCQGQDMAIFHTELANSNFQKYTFYTSFIGLSEEYLAPLYHSLSDMTSEEIKEYVQVQFNTQEVSQHLDKLNFSFLADQELLATEMTFKEDLEYVEVSIQPKFFTFIQDLPTLTLLSGRRLKSLEGNLNLRRILQLGNISDADLKTVINSAGGISSLSNILRYRTTQYTQIIILENLQKSMVIDFSKLLTVAYILGLTLKLTFLALIAITILSSLYGVNFKSRVLHFWVYTTVTITTYFATNQSLSPVFRKFAEMIVVGWFSDIFQVDFNIQRYSSHFETIYYSRLGDIGAGFVISNLARFLILINLTIGKIVTMKCDTDLKLEEFNFPNLKRKHPIIRFYYNAHKHMHTLGLVICLHILSSNLVDFKLSFGYMTTNQVGIKVYRYLIFMSILMAQAYILLYSIEYYKLLPKLPDLFSLSLFMRIDMGLGIQSQRSRIGKREDDYYGTLKGSGSIEEGQSLVKNSGGSGKKDNGEIDSIIEEKRDSISVLKAKQTIKNMKFQPIEADQKLVLVKKKRIKKGSKKVKIGSLAKRSSAHKPIASSNKTEKSLNSVDENLLKSKHAFSADSYNNEVFKGEGQMWELPSIQEHSSKFPSPNMIEVIPMKQTLFQTKSKTSIFLNEPPTFTSDLKKLHEEIIGADSSSVESDNEKNQEGASLSKKTPKFLSNVGIERMASENYKSSKMTFKKKKLNSGGGKSNHKEQRIKSKTNTHDFETIYFDHEESHKNSIESQQDLLSSPEPSNFGPGKKTSKFKRKTAAKFKSKTPQIGFAKNRLNPGHESRQRSRKQNSIKIHKFGKKSSGKLSSRNVSRPNQNNGQHKVHQVTRRKRKVERRLSSVIFLKNEKQKPYLIERSPVEHNNIQESSQVNDSVDEYLFLMLDSLKPFNFNIRDLNSEYQSIKTLLKEQLRRNIEEEGNSEVNNTVISNYLMPLVKFPSLIILPALILMSLAQVSSPVNGFFINIAIIAIVIKLLCNKFFRLNIMKTMLQHALIVSILILVALINFFQAFFTTNIAKIGFWAYQIQIFLMIYLCCVLIAIMGWILYEIIDSYYSWKRYKEDQGWDFLKNDYEFFRKIKKFEQVMKKQNLVVKVKHQASNLHRSNAPEKWCDSLQQIQSINKLKFKIKFQNLILILKNFMETECLQTHRDIVSNKCKVQRSWFV